MKWKPDIVNTFQGAFGPPTIGHYTAMRTAARATLKSHPGRNILMLFMPTAQSPVKPHLEQTRDARLLALNIFCDKLNKEFNNIRFETSKIEYDLFDRTHSTSTILTLEALAKEFPDSQIELTLGLDNLFMLPFWTRIEDYPDYITKIYVVNRDLDDDDKGAKEAIKLKGTTVLFSKTAPWTKDTLEDKLSKTINGKTLVEILSKIHFVYLPKPPSVSSTILRGALKAYYGNSNNTSYNKIRALTGIDHVRRNASDKEKERDPWYMTYKLTGGGVLNRLETPVTHNVEKQRRRSRHKHIKDKLKDIKSLHGTRNRRTHHNI